MPRVGPELAQSWPRTGQGVDRESAVVATGAWSRSSWQLNALIRVLSTSLADKHADTLNWVLLQLLLPASLCPGCLPAAAQRGCGIWLFEVAKRSNTKKIAAT